MPTAGLTIRALTPGDGLDELFDLRCRAFGPVGASGRAYWQAENEPVIRAGRYLAGYDGSRLVAAGRFHDMTQWWCGRPVPMAGVASVAVAPEERGRGVGRALMTGLLELIASRGYPLSVLYPYTRPIYRSLGWEIAGTQHEAVLPAHALRSLALAGVGGARRVRRAGPADAAAAIAALGRVHGSARDCGPNVRDEDAVRSLLGDQDNYGYLADDGLLAYHWRDGHDEIFVQVAAASSAETTRALWGIVASHCWVADTVRARIAPADPFWWLIRESCAVTVDRDDWMLRVVDPAAAIAARGFPAGVAAAAWLDLSDDIGPGHSGRWRLEVGGGRGSLSRDGRQGAGVGGAETGSPALALGARGLAALYAGAPVSSLRRAGLADGGNAVDDALLDSAFAATPFLLDRF
ncbi:MAG TPA: GNAT family N-acetyltransferase [Streptosporangiaceae bacterium]